MKKIPDSVFKPKPTASENKSDTTTRAARQIIDGERADRDAKTKRLRLARLEKEEDSATAAPSKPKPRSVKRAALT